MMSTDAISWIFGIANPLSALLVGPAFFLLLRWRMGKRGEAIAVRAQGVGWIVLGVAQAALLTFGFILHIPGITHGQPFMIPVAIANYLAWSWLLKQQRANASKG